MRHFGEEASTTKGAGAGDAVWVWVRDGWLCSEATVRSDVRRMGMDDPGLRLHLPKQSTDELLGHITSAEAAWKLLAARGVPSSPDGLEAQESMNSLITAEANRDRIIKEIVRAAWSSTVVAGRSTSRYCKRGSHPLPNRRLYGCSPVSRTGMAGDGESR